jgi:hypothetical protein
LPIETFLLSPNAYLRYGYTKGASIPLERRDNIDSNELEVFQLVLTIACWPGDAFFLIKEQELGLGFAVAA